MLFAPVQKHFPRKNAAMFILIEPQSKTTATFSLVMSHAKSMIAEFAQSFNCVFSDLAQSQAMFTLGAQAPVTVHQHKIVLCSNTGYPR